MLNNNHVFIIAEAGVNHNGDINIAKKLIEAAANAGADAVKFQTFKAEKLVTKDAPKAEYQKKSTGNVSQFEMLKNLELSYQDHILLKKCCEEKGILFLSTPFDFESVDILEELNIPIYKIGSGDLTNIPLLRYIAKLRKPMIISTGMSNLGEVETAIGTVNKVGNSQISLLHCTSNYPASYESVNLKAMITLKNAFNVPVGYSDHTEGIEIPLAATAMGAEVIEKHFTLDRNMDGPDHKASLNPAEFRQMVQGIRNIEKAIGDGIKKPCNSEENTKIAARKSIVAKINIKKGEVISYNNVDFKRPGTGVSPEYTDLIIGKKALCDIDKDDFISFSNIK